MGTLIDKLNKIKETKNALKAAFTAKGVTVSDTFSSYPDKVNEVYEAGKNKMLDVISANGKRFKCLFLSCRTNTLPYIDTTPAVDLEMMYNGCVNLNEIQELNLPNAKRVYYTFTNCPNLTEIIITNMSSSADRPDYMFGNNSGLSKIHTLDFSGITNGGNTAFVNCISLSDVKFKGVIASTVAFQWCPLSNESIANIIECLKDYSGTDTWKTITFGSTNIAKLTDEQKATMYNKQWNYK